MRTAFSAKGSLGFVLTFLILLGIGLYAVFAAATAVHAEESKPKCVAALAFSENIAKAKGNMTAVPKSKLAFVRKLATYQDKSAAGAVAKADKAWFASMPDGSSAIVFASGPCISVVALMPPSLRAPLQAFLFSEPVAARPKHEGWIPDAYGRLEI